MKNLKVMRCDGTQVELDNVVTVRLSPNMLLATHADGSEWGMNLSSIDYYSYDPLS